MVVIEQLKQTRETLDKLLALLESREADRFASHLYQSRREYRHVCERPGKGNKAVERTVLSTFQIAESLGFKVGASPMGAIVEDREANSSLFLRGNCQLAGNARKGPSEQTDAQRDHQLLGNVPA